MAVTREEISITRRFYPFRSGGTSRTHLWEALGMDPVTGLRVCERPLPGVQSGASPLFWTLGGKQMGKRHLQDGLRCSPTWPQETACSGPSPVTSANSFSPVR